LIQNEDLKITQQTLNIQDNKEIVEEISTEEKINFELPDRDYTKNKNTKQSINFNEHVDKNNFEIDFNKM